MIPRLAPRRSRRQSPLTVTAGVENATPFLAMKTDSTVNSPVSDQARPRIKRHPESGDLPPLSPQPPPLKEHNPELHKRRVLSDKSASENAPLSPSPSTTFVEYAKSPASTNVFSDRSILSDASSDYSVTPPATGPRPLVVSAKRLGQDVRRKHSKRRRCRSRRGQAKTQNGFCLWKDTDRDSTPSQDSSSDEDCGERAGLPFLFSEQEVSPKDKTRHYWEWCYGKGDTIELSMEQGFSAKRAPPARGCLSNSRPRRKPSSTDRFKTPPTSPEEMEETQELSSKRKKNARVQFGSIEAAEFEVDGPAGKLTPMPSRVARERYSMDGKEETEVEVEITQETKQNSALLAEWEDEFEQPRSTSRRRRKNRRSSSLFLPSPMLASKEIDSDSRNTHPDPMQQASSAPSPSVVVMKELASLKMGSPAKESKYTSESSHSTVTNSKHASDHILFEENDDTAEFRVSLNAVHSTGGAMDTTPPQQSQHDTPQSSVLSVSRRLSSSSADTTPPPTNVSLDAIHSVGGALDHESPALTSQQSSASLDNTSPPLSMMKLCQTGSKISQASLPSMQDEAKPKSNFEAANLVDPPDIIKKLLETPGADQEWESADVFRNLSLRQPTARPDSVLVSVDSRQNGILACVDDLLEQAKYHANNKSKIPAKSMMIAGQVVAKEWKELELEFFNNLTQTMEQETFSLDEELEGIKLPAPRSNVSHLKKTTEKEVADLRLKISKQREALEVSEAVEAPFSALHCQASSHLGLCGFRIDGYTGDRLELSYEHIIEGIESRFVFDLQNLSFEASRITSAMTSCQGMISVNQFAAEFHQYFLKTIVDSPTSSMHGSQPLELHETILILSRRLSQLDLATADLIAVSKSATVRLDLPCVEVTCPSGLVIRAKYEQHESPAKGFLPTKVWTRRQGSSEAEVEVRPDIDKSKHFLRNLLERYSRS